MSTEQRTKTLADLGSEIADITLQHSLEDTTNVFLTVVVDNEVKRLSIDEVALTYHLHKPYVNLVCHTEQEIDYPSVVDDVLMRFQARITSTMIDLAQELVEEETD